MCKYCIIYSFLIPIFEQNLNMESTDWKSRSLQRSKENKKLKKTIKELKISRESWKEKSISNKIRADKLEINLKKVKVKMNEIIFLK